MKRGWQHSRLNDETFATHVFLTELYVTALHVMFSWSTLLSTQEMFCFQLSFPNSVVIIYAAQKFSLYCSLGLLEASF